MTYKMVSVEKLSQAEKNNKSYGFKYKKIA